LVLSLLGWKNIYCYPTDIVHNMNSNHLYNYSDYTIYIIYLKWTIFSKKHVIIMETFIFFQICLLCQVCLHIYTRRMEFTLMQVGLQL